MFPKENDSLIYRTTQNNTNTLLSINGKYILMMLECFNLIEYMCAIEVFYRMLLIKGEVNSIYN